MLLANIGREQIAIRDLVERGYYQGSDVAHLKKLVEMGYSEQARSAHDRRSVSISLTEQALAVVDDIRDLEQRIAKQLDGAEEAGMAIDAVCQVLRQVERTWTDYVHYARG